MAGDREVGDIVKNISEDVKVLVRGEVELAKAELIPPAKSAGIGAGMFAGAGVLALYALGILLIGGALALALVVPPWAAFLIVGGIILLICGILALIGKASMNKAKFSTDKTVAEATATVNAVKGAASRAATSAKTPAISRHSTKD
ncbi:phage holin family protein [Propionibacteriaceae bacterium Y1685]|uniref:phage holin family protein n=1 Tax=Microlunatus sp. Y1700 TaxID=3418487 RepID=UPI003B7E7786